MQALEDRGGDFLYHHAAVIIVTAPRPFFSGATVPHFRLGRGVGGYPIKISGGLSLQHMIIGGAYRSVEGFRIIRGSLPRVLQRERDVCWSLSFGPMLRPLSTTRYAMSFDRETPTTFPVLPLRRPCQQSRRTSSHANPEERKINRR